MFSKRSRGTLNQSDIEILARTCPGKMARMVTLYIFFFGGGALKYKLSLEGACVSSRGVCGCVRVCLGVSDHTQEVNAIT